MKRDYNILDSDFFLADLFSDENHPIDENLRVLLEVTHYRVQKSKGQLFAPDKIIFKDDDT